MAVQSLLERRVVVAVGALLLLTGCQRDPLSPGGGASAASGARASAVRPAMGDALDAELAAVGAEADALLWQVDVAWQGGSSMRGVVAPVPTGLVIDCQILGYQARLAAARAASRGGVVFEAIGRRDLPRAQEGLGALAGAVPEAVTLITTYVECEQAPPPGDGGGGSPPPDRWR